jgi:hypothetical protein
MIVIVIDAFGLYMEILHMRRATSTPTGSCRPFCPYFIPLSYPIPLLIQQDLALARVSLMSTAQAEKDDDCVAGRLRPKQGSLEPFSVSPHSSLKVWGNPNFFYARLSLLPHPRSTLGYSRNRDAERKHGDMDNYIQIRVQPEREASRDPGKHKRRLCFAISEFIRSNKKSKSVQVSFTVCNYR